MKKAEITVFLALLLSSVCALFCIIIESARTQAMRLQIEQLMDAGLHSCFGEYQQELFSRYDLLYIDSSYGKAEGSTETVLRHLQAYIEENTDEGAKRSGDWFRLSIEEVQAGQYLLASDRNGHALRNQAVNYIKAYGDSSHLSVTAQAADEIGQISGLNFMGEWEAAIRLADGFGKSFTNPSKLVKEMCSKDILELIAVNGAAGNKGFLSAVPYAQLPSKRHLKTGTKGRGIAESENAEALFDEYLLQKCADYTDSYGDSVLCCELEYILYGKESDRENLEQAASRLMELKQGENLAALYSDEGKCMEAEELAEKVVGVYEIGELTEAVRDSVIYAWAYAESAIEVSRLLAGGRAEVHKSSGAWELPLENLLEFRTYIGKNGGSGLLYEEYLGAFLHRAEPDVKTGRCMDVIEMNLRTLKNPSFRIDGCVEYLEAEVFFESGFGYNYRIKRDFSYENSYRGDS